MILATVISRVFEPQMVLFFISVTAGIRSRLVDAWVYFALVSALFLLVLWYRLKMVKSGKVNWDVSERTNRIRPLLILILILVVVGWLIGKFNNSLLSETFFLFLSWTIGFWLITLFYKISGHVGILTLVCGLLIRWFGKGFWPIYLTIPLLAWSRVKLKAHTVGQVTAGFLYSYLYEIGTGLF